MTTTSGSGTDGVTRELVDFVRSTNIDTMRPETVHATKRLIIDTLACTIGALNTDPAQAIHGLKRDQGGAQEATLIGSRIKVPATSAAYVHAQMANILDADDTLNWTHSACVSVMATIAVAEKVGATGAELIAAAAVAYDVGVRIAFSMPVYKIDDEGHLGRRGAVGFSWSAYGAAAGAGKLLGLDQDQLGNAFGIAHVSMPPHGTASAFTGVSQPWHKYAMYAAIAEAGVNGALLADRGFVADSRVFDEGTQFFRSLNAESSDRSVMTAGLGEDWAVEKAGIKPWPFCRYGHGILDAFAELVEQNDLRPDDITGVTLTIPPYGFIEMIASSVEVDEKLKIMTSLPYALAMVAHRITPGPQWWSDEVFEDSAIRNFARRVSSQVDEGLNEAFLSDLKAGRQLTSARTPGLVQVETRSKEYSRVVEHCVGDPADPTKVLPDDRVRAKVIEYCEGILAPGAGKAIADAGFALEHADDLSALMGPCADPA